MTQQIDATIEIVEMPQRVSRLLGRFPDGTSYVATWVQTKLTIREERDKDGKIVKLKEPRIEHVNQAVIITRDLAGAVRLWGALGNAIPPEWDVRLGYQPPADNLLSASAIRRVYASKDDEFRLVDTCPDIVDVFARAVSVADRFLDLSHGVSDQRELCELLATYIVATWLSDGFAAFPYLWPNGDKGAGKTKLLSVVARLSYLGQVILAGGTYAAIRDLAEYGATLAFDDAENLSDARKADPDKRALLLAGNRKGASVPVKEPEGKNGWKIRNVSSYCPKLFSAIRMPDPVLARRTIVLPLVRSADPNRANHDIEEDQYWPCDRRQLVDDLWFIGLHYLDAAKTSYDQAVGNGLTGPGFEPWRPLFATAQLIEAAGVEGLTGRLRHVATSYQTQRSDFEFPDATRVAVQAIAEVSDVWTLSDVSDVSKLTLWGSDEKDNERLIESVTFTANQVADVMNRIAQEEGIRDSEEDFTNARKVGRILDSLRIERQRDSGKKRTRLRIVSRKDVLKLCSAYGVSDVSCMDEPGTETSETSLNVQTSDADKPSRAFTVIDKHSNEWTHQQVVCSECHRPLQTAWERTTFICRSCMEALSA